ncbi:MAG: hybrid sensor histidine kinase/response regulator [Arcobacteraceae bacterium]|nr:hybrid sensor histidine kinase/response regulator [Arcobacteraceae bacterium]
MELEDLVEFSQTVRVLYVEDNSDLREDTLGIFSIFFNKIDTATDGIDGLNQFMDNKYDLIITGIDMPNMDGLEMITKIRKISKHITILIISADTKHFIDVIKLGVDGYILKPVEIKQFTSVLQKVIEKLQDKEELYQYRNHLEKKVEDEIFKRRASEKVLIQQSKLAAMGEMIDAVAHQWKQPINIIKIHTDMIGYDFEDGNINKAYINKFQTKVFNQVNHITNTLNEFRSFFRPNKETHPFNIKDSIDSILVLIHDDFIKNKIEIEVNIKSDFIIDGIENEFKHIILNIANNSKDAFNENNIKHKKIIITTNSDNISKQLEIQDNAGGIPEYIIDDIFKANVTSKAEGKGTGIGLYMTKQIIEKYNGTIEVKNIKDGAIFTINFKSQ